MLLLMTEEVVLVLGPHNYPTEKKTWKIQSGWGFISYQRERKALPNVLFRSRDNQVGASGGTLIGVSAGDVKGVIGTRTTHLTYQKVDF